MEVVRERLNQLRDKFKNLGYSTSTNIGNSNTNTTVTLPKKNGIPQEIHDKDQAKSDKANKFIGFGSPNSFTDLYAKAWDDKANVGTYTKTDVVFVSINGNRKDRVGIDAYTQELDKAIEAGATFITDTKAYREGSKFNIGERELASYLESKGYTEANENGVWTKNTDTVTEDTIDSNQAKNNKNNTVQFTVDNVTHNIPADLIDTTVIANEVSSKLLEFTSNNQSQYFIPVIGMGHIIKIRTREFSLLSILNQ